MSDKVEERSMVNVLNRLRKDGCTLDFKVNEDGQMTTMDGKKAYTPEEVRIVDFYRFEGQSNPDDMSILYVLEATDGTRGSITNSYGPYADENIENFMKQVEDMGKNLDKKDK